MLHVLLAVIGVILVALAVAVSVLARQQRADRRTADARHRQNRAHHEHFARRIGEVSAGTRPCPRTHAGDLPLSMFRSPSWGEPDEPPPSTLRSNT